MFFDALFVNERPELSGIVPVQNVDNHSGLYR
jgi:hypothetical protein